MSDFAFKMLAGDRIYVELETLPEKSKGGVFLPQNQASASRKGVVKQIGPAVTLYKPGDRIVVSAYTGVGLYLLEEEMTDATHSVYREGEIVGTI